MLCNMHVCIIVFLQPLMLFSRWSFQWFLHQDAGGPAGHVHGMLPAVSRQIGDQRQCGMSCSMGAPYLHPFLFLHRAGLCYSGSPARLVMFWWSRLAGLVTIIQSGLALDCAGQR